MGTTFVCITVLTFFNCILHVLADDRSSQCRIRFNGMIRNYTGCGRISSDIEVFWNIREEDGEIDTLFRGKSDGYAAIGWGYKQMIGSKAVVVYNNGSDGVSIDEFDLLAKNPLGVNSVSTTTFKNGLAEFVDGKLVGSYTIKIGNNEEMSVSVNETNSIIWAVGPKSAIAGQLQIHKNHGIGELNLMTKIDNNEEGTKQSSSSSSSSNGTNYRQFRYYAHAALMSIGWLIVIPIGILTIRFKRPGRTSFKIHSGLNVLGTLMIIAGIILVAFRGSIAWIHLIVGIVGIVSPVLQIVIAIARPDASAERRESRWYKIHASIGYISYLFANLNVHIGIRFYGGRGGLVFHGILGFLGICFIISLLVLQMRKSITKTDERKRYEEPI